MISYYQGATRDGKAKRHREYFTSKGAAQTAAAAKRAELLNLGRTDDQITEDEARAIFSARKLFPTLPARFDGQPHSIKLAVEAYGDAMRKQRKQTSVAALSADYIAAKIAAKKSPRHISDLRSRLERFGQRFGDRDASSLTSQEIVEWIFAQGESLTTAANYRKVLRALFGFALRTRSVETNVMLELEAIHWEKNVEVISPRELGVMIRSADPRIVPAIALAAFCGIREAELARLTWEDVQLSRSVVILSQRITKTSRRRVVPISDNCAEWLRTAFATTGPVVPVGARTLVDAARRAAGFGGPGTETAAEKAAGVRLRPWPTNALRHSAASHLLSRDQNANSVALMLGNSAATLLTHYHQIVAPEETVEWWEIRPGRVGP